MNLRRCRLLLPVLFMLTPFALPQARFAPTLDEAKKWAAAENQYIVLDVAADWCPPCQRMQKEVYPDPEFAEYSKTRVFLVVDAYKNPEGRRLSARFNVKSFPTLIVLDAGGKEIDRFSGGRDTRGLIADIDLILEDPRPFKEVVRSAEESPDDLGTQLRAGRRALGHDDHKRARRFFGRADELATRQDSESLPDVLVALHQACFEDEAWEEALECQDRLEKLSPAYRSSAVWQLQRARILISLDRNDEALQILNEALKAESMRDRAEARAVFDRLPKKYRKHEKELAKLLEKARKSLDKKKYAEAIERAEQALEMDSSHAPAYVVLAQGWIGSAADASGETRAELQARGLRSLRLARCLDRSDYLSYQTARELLAADLIQSLPDDEKARKKYLNAEKHFAAKRYKNAADDYIEALQIEPTFARGYLHLGDCHFANGNYENALKLYQEAARRAPLDAATYRFAADALEQLGRNDEAYRWLVESLVADPEYPLVWTDLRRAAAGKKPFERHPDLVPPRLLVAGPDDDYEALFRDLPPRTVPAWREYVNHRLYWKDARFSEQFPDAAAYYATAREERECLEKLVERWDTMKRETPGLADEKLDFIREVAIEGYLDSLVFLELYGEEYRPEYQAWVGDNRSRIGEYLDLFIFGAPVRWARSRGDGVSRSALRAYNRGASLHASAPEEAIVHYQRALAHAPRYGRAMGNLSSLYWRTDRLDDAASLAERWLELEPDSYRPYDQLSLVEYRRGNRERAVELVKKAIELADDPEQRARLERNLKAFGGSTRP